MFKIQGTTADGDLFYADGSDTGKVFASREDALVYAVRYALAVGDVTIRTDKHDEDGYYETIRVVES